MNRAVVYYSLSGNTKEAERLLQESWEQKSLR